MQSVHIRDNLDLLAERLSHQPGRRADRRGRHLSRARAGDQSGTRVRQAAGHRDARSGLRHGGGLDRAGRARARADARLHRGRCQHRHRHAPEQHHPGARARAARATRKCSSCSTAWPRARRSWSRIWCRRRLPLGVVVRVLQGLLAERVPIRNMRTIVETLAEHAPRTQDPAVLQAQVRVALGRQIVQDIAGSGAELPVITLEPDLEQLLQTSSAGTGRRQCRARARTGRAAAGAAGRVGAAPGGRRRSRRC